MPALRKPLTPAQALARGRRAIAERRAAEAWARRPAWSAPALVETTVVRLSPAAPERWPRVWRAPIVSGFAAPVAVEKTGIGKPSDGCAAAPATEPEKSVDLSTDRIERLVAMQPQPDPIPPATKPPRPVRTAKARPLKRDVDSAPKTEAAAVAKHGSLQNPTTPAKTQQAFASARESAAQKAPSCVKPIAGSTTLIPAATIVSPELNEHPPGAWPLTALREGQCRFACTPHDAASHRFCGAPVAWLKGKPTSWCSDHLPVVTGAPGRTAGGASVADALSGRHGPEDGRRSVDCVRTGAWR